MSLASTSTALASRHFRRHLFSNSNVANSSQLRIGGGNASVNSLRQFSTNGSKGSGLRRTQSKGRHAATPQSQQSSSTSKTSVSSEMTNDPHAIANEMVSAASTKPRPPGTESVATLTREQKISNFAMAAGLGAFVSYIFYYSLASVGGGDNAKALLFGSSSSDDKKDDDETTGAPGFEEFLKEANEGRSIEEKRVKAEQEARGEARELVELEGSTAARLKAEGVGEEVIATGSEEEEREMARVAGFVDGEEVVKKRPMWKRVVFFWRKE